MATAKQAAAPQSAKVLILPKDQEIAILAVLLLLGYSRIVNTYFLADDFSLIQAVVDAQGKPDWSMFVRHLFSGQNQESFRPLVTFFHVLGYSLWGAAPAGYHLLNLFFHFFNCLCLYTLVASLHPFTFRLLPFVTAALFVTHPLHPEAVTYIGSLPGLACAAFYFFALICYVQYRFAERSSWIAISLFSFALALGTKEEAVSLPFAVGLITLCFIQRPLCIRQMLWLLWDCAKYFFVLALYFAYRVYVFGHLTPPYFSGWPWWPRSIARGIGLYLGRLAAPVNFPYVEPFGQVLYAGMLALLSGILLFSVYRRPPKVSPVLFCCAGFLVFLLPLLKVLIFGIDPGLTNSRYGYFPSITFVTGIAVTLFSGKKENAARIDDILIVVLLLSMQLSLLIINNQAWVQASVLMQFTQQESRRLTGNSIDVEVVNLPDTVNGVLFNRGGFQRALLYPFVPDNTLHHRERIVTIEQAEDEDLRIEGTFSESEVLSWRMDPEEKATMGTRRHQLRVVFQPQEARTYSGEIIIRNATCSDPVATIPVRGQGTTALPFPTYLAAAVRPGPAPADPTQPLTYLAAVADVPDGIPAEGVSISLLPGVPWHLQYFALTADGKQEAPDTPVRIPDGETRHFVLEVTPLGPSHEVFLAPRISGINTPPVLAIRGQTTIELPARENAPMTGAEPNSQEDVTESTKQEHPVAPCAAVSVTPAELDFGLVPTSPYALPPQPFSYLGQTPALLFWDNLGERLLPFPAVAKAESVLRVSGPDLAQWQRSPHLTTLQISPTIAALQMEEDDQFLYSPAINISAPQVAYFLVQMRILNASTPYAVLWWRGEKEEAYTKWASVVTVPDGYWHTYAIPLHSYPAWRSTGQIRHLRFAPILSSGWVEIASLALIGPIP